MVFFDTTEVLSSEDGAGAPVLVTSLVPAPLRLPASAAACRVGPAQGLPVRRRRGHRLVGMSQPSTPAPQPPTLSIPLSDAKRWRAYWVCVAVAGLTIL